MVPDQIKSQGLFIMKTLNSQIIQGEIELGGKHDVDKGWIKDVRNGTSSPKIVS